MQQRFDLGFRDSVEALVVVEDPPRPIRPQHGLIEVYSVFQIWHARNGTKSNSQLRNQKIPCSDSKFERIRLLFKLLKLGPAGLPVWNHWMRYGDKHPCILHIRFSKLS